MCLKGVGLSIRNKQTSGLLLLCCCFIKHPVKINLKKTGFILTYDSRVRVHPGWEDMAADRNSLVVESGSWLVTFSYTHRKQGGGEN